jgi:hypothetical protein
VYHPGIRHSSGYCAKDAEIIVWRSRVTGPAWLILGQFAHHPRHLFSKPSNLVLHPRPAERGQELAELRLDTRVRRLRIVTGVVRTSSNLASPRPRGKDAPTFCVGTPFPCWRTIPHRSDRRSCYLVVRLYGTHVRRRLSPLQCRWMNSDPARWLTPFSNLACGCGWSAFCLQLMTSPTLPSRSPAPCLGHHEAEKSGG